MSWQQEGPARDRVSVRIHRISVPAPRGSPKVTKVTKLFPLPMPRSTRLQVCVVGSVGSVCSGELYIEIIHQYHSGKQKKGC